MNAHQALVIFQQNNHPDSFISLEKLADLYFKKFIQEKDKGNIPQAQLFKQKASSYLTKAKVVVKTHFPANSPHVNSIQDKLKNFE